MILISPRESKLSLGRTLIRLKLLRQVDYKVGKRTAALDFDDKFIVQKTARKVKQTRGEFVIQT